MKISQITLHFLTIFLQRFFRFKAFLLNNSKLLNNLLILWNKVCKFKVVFWCTFSTICLASRMWITIKLMRVVEFLIIIFFNKSLNFWIIFVQKIMNFSFVIFDNFFMIFSIASIKRFCNLWYIFWQFLNELLHSNSIWLKIEVFWNQQKILRSWWKYF